MRIIMSILLLVLLPCSLYAKVKDAKLKKLDNGVISIGVDQERGACIGYLALSSDKTNLLNHYDEGRFVQQSYYGKADGSDWNGKPWVFNPVQGGSWDLNPSKIIEMKVNSNQDELYTKTIPRHWATGNLCHDSIMEQTISLSETVASIDFKFSYTGEDQGDPRHQEMPAVFVDGTLKTFVYHKDGVMIKENNIEVLDEGKEGEEGKEGKEGKGGTDGLSYGKSSSHWFAWLDEHGRGVGIYTPGTEDFKVYRALGDGSTGPHGSACSYLAPLRTFSLTKGLVLEYTAYLTIGSLDEIQARFEALRTIHNK